MKLLYKTHFDAAHSLPDYQGDCSRLHGHTWYLEFEFYFPGMPGKTGMFIDFKDLKEIIEYYIKKYYDHRLLNENIENPTAENLVKHLYDLIKPKFNPLKTIRLWESPTYGVEYGGEE